LYSGKITNIFSGILGAIEAGVPSLVAVTYFLSFVGMAWVSESQLNMFKFVVLLIGLLIELLMIVTVNVVGYFVRYWVFKRRLSVHSGNSA
jgi:hypothetical protein